jgi:hypothetical protein
LSGHGLSVPRVSESGFLHVAVVGDNTPETVLRYVKELRVLRDAEVPECPGRGRTSRERAWLGEIFGVVPRGSKSVWPVVQRIAYVDVNRDHDLKNMKFAETVGMNRSMNIRVFAEVRDAENWLLSS